MKNATLSKLVLSVILATVITGCAYQRGPIDGLPWLKNSIKEQRWRSAFLHYTHIYQTAPRADVDEAIQLVRENPEVAEAGYSIFQPEALRDWVARTNSIDNDFWIQTDALCTIVSDSQCIQARENLTVAESLVTEAKPGLAVVKGAYDGLTIAERKRLEERYSLRFYDGAEIGTVVERQTQNNSSAGSTAGSDAGSALASTVYINNAISNGTYNVWTDLAVSVLGGVAGSAANKSATTQYLIQYTIRNKEDQLKSVVVTTASSIGAPIGSCFSISLRRTIEESLCLMTSASLREKYLK